VKLVAKTGGLKIILLLKTFFLFYCSTPKEYFSEFSLVNVLRYSIEQNKSVAIRCPMGIGQFVPVCSVLLHTSAIY